MKKYFIRDVVLKGEFDNVSLKCGAFKPTFKG